MKHNTSNLPEQSLKRSILATAVRRGLSVGGTAMTLSLSPVALAQGAFGAAVELSDLDGSDGFVINGVSTFDRAGLSVSSAGDVNGDGIDDVIVGAFGADPAGKSYVVFGGAAVGLSGTFELSDLDGSNGYVINGTNNNSGLGYSVSEAGDINGDGVGDLIIGALFVDESYVVFGGADVGMDGVFEISDLDGSNGFVIKGADEFYSSIYSGSEAGDINGDGVDDLIVGAPFANRGESYVVFGGVDTGSSGRFELSELDGSNGFVLSGIDLGDRSGFSVSGAGDINGDGVDDLAIVAPFANPVGETYVVFGGGSVGTGGSLELSDLDGSDGFLITGADESYGTVYSVSEAGDVNGDGFDDLIIGGPYSGPDGVSYVGESYVVFGGADIGSGGSFELSDLDGNDGFLIRGNTLTTNLDSIINVLGASVSGAGDVNGDGVDDLIIGESWAAPNGVELAGESYVLFGGANISRGNTVELSELDNLDGFVINGIDSNDYSGRSVSEAGDVNGDGVDDLIVGTRNADPNGRESAGESYVIFGKVESSVITCNGLAVTVDISLGQTPGSGDDVILGTAGNDDIRSGAGNDTICGMAGDDFILGGTGDDWIDGGNGKDDIRGGGGDDEINGGNGNDTIRGDSGNDLINGGDANDILIGGSGLDRLNGNKGDDLISGGGDEDTLRGGNGNDLINGGNHDDTIDGGLGNDRINGGNDDDTIEGGSGRDILNGNDGDDEITGGPGVDVINGGDGNDILRGWSGSDKLNGNAGNDFLSGGGNTADSCNGGSGTDVATSSCESVLNVP